MADSRAVIAYKLSAAMAYGLDVKLKVGPPLREIKGKVTRRWIDKQIKIDASDKDQSNLMIEISGQEIAVQNVIEVKRKVRA